MRIYFAGSIRGGREDREVYAQIIEYLKQYGEVLTEHVCYSAVTHDGDPGLACEEIYARDMEWLKSADVVVAEVSTPSLGVGYEVCYAAEAGIPVLCLFRSNGKSVSAMIAGDRRLNVICYTSAEEALEKISAFLERT